MSTNFYQERLEAKRERIEGAAAKAAAESAARLDKARQMADMIPLGQPILVDHYSAPRHRSHLAKIQSNATKGFELADKAQRLGDRAEGLGRHGTASDDPEAVVKLKAKLAGEVETRERMKATNAAIRKHAKKGTEAQVAALVELGWSEVRAHKILTPDFGGRIGFPSYALSNLGANIRRIEKRIEELSSIVLDDESFERSGTAADGSDWSMELAEGRYVVTFDRRCDDEVRQTVKAHGFVWAPSRGAWTRKVTPNAARAAETLARRLTTPAE